MALQTIELHSGFSGNEFLRVHKLRVVAEGPTDLERIQKGDTGLSFIFYYSSLLVYRTCRLVAVFW
jgi:hypothetical protein